MEKAKILVVEDEAVIAKNLQRRLEKMGHSVPAVIATGEEALKETKHQRPDLVLMDIVLLGEMDGIEAADQIRACCDIPVIYLTAYADKKTLKRAKKTEPFGYIVKPFEDKELSITIEMALYKHRMEKRVRERESWLSTTLKSIGDAVIATDAEGRVTFMNPVAQSLTGWKQKKAAGRPLREIFMIINEKTGNVEESPATRVIRNNKVIGLKNHSLVAKDGTKIPIGDSAAPIKDEKGNIIGVVLVFSDISELRKREEEREKLIHDLQSALAEVKTLTGMLPICASCKKIRDDEGYWNQIESYVEKHSGVKFSHGLCPACVKKLYPEYYEEILGKNK